jgi:hypothetical protein
MPALGILYCLLGLLLMGSYSWESLPKSQIALAVKIRQEKKHQNGRGNNTWQLAAKYRASGN